MGMMRKFRRALRGAASSVIGFNMSPGYGLITGELLREVARGGKITDDQIWEVLGDPRDFQAGKPVAFDDDEGGEARHVSISAGHIILPGPPGGKATALVSMRGIALYDIEYQPLCFSTLLLAQTMDMLGGNPDIGTIIIDCDSPGGSVVGVQEAGDAVWNARKRNKKIVALVNPLCCSAAYWIASQAEEIVCVPSADVGSVGVFMAHTDCSGFDAQQGMKITYIYAGEFKVEGNSHEPLAETARDNYQREVNIIYNDFTKTVARGRGKTQAEVKENFGKGRSVMAREALEAGMIDEIQPLKTALMRFGIVTGGGSSGRRGALLEAAVPTVPTLYGSGVGTMTVRTETAEDGTKKFFVDGLPNLMAITSEAIDSGGICKVSGRQLDMKFANGLASYKLLAYLGNESTGLYALMSGQLEPVTEQQDEGAPDEGAAGSGDAGDAGEPQSQQRDVPTEPDNAPEHGPDDEEDEDCDGKALAERNRRALELLSL